MGPEAKNYENHQARFAPFCFFKFRGLSRMSVARKFSFQLSEFNTPAGWDNSLNVYFH